MTFLAVVALLAWIYLIFLHGRFWQSGPTLPDNVLPSEPRRLPPVAIVVPARDEAPVIQQTLRSLLTQDYTGDFSIILVDDNSTDGTGDIARDIHDPSLTVVSGAPRPAGWSGKLWAVQQGVEEAEARATELILLTDADIVHQPGHLTALVAQAERRSLDLVSEMVTLACESWAERALVPAFVFFFQLLYPFAWVNDPLKATAAAAGGTVLIRRSALRRIGGIEGLKSALIDDVALAAAVKKSGPIWLGHATKARSIRPYPHASDIWRMIARTAYVQLRYSPFLLLATIVAMSIVWVVPLTAAVWVPGSGRWYGIVAWLLMTFSYFPTLFRYGLSPLWALTLPFIAIFYLAATIGSAMNHYFGRGVSWKGRAYQGTTG